MKRVVVGLFLICMVAALAGCASAPLGTGTPEPTVMAAPAVTVVPTATPSPVSMTATPDASPTPTAEPEPTKIVPTTTVYTSTNFGLSFTMPDSWVGKYGVEEGTGYLSVYTNPDKPFGDNSLNEELFTIVKPDNNNDGPEYSEWQFTANGNDYVWGFNDDMPYGLEESEYDRFHAMLNEIPTIFKTLRSASGQTITDVKKLQIELVPKKGGEYITTLGMGIAFELPDSCKNKCRVVETKDTISFFFIPKEPWPDRYGAFMFIIEKKTPETACDESDCDGVQEFTVNGLTYFYGGATDVEYEGPEQDAYYSTLSAEEIVDTIRAVM